MKETQRNVRVTHTTEQPSPKTVRRLGRALIALAQAQLEAEAQAEAETAQLGGVRPATTRADARTEQPTGDAA